MKGEALKNQLKLTIRKSEIWPVNIFFQSLFKNGKKRPPKNLIDYVREFQTFL